MRSQLVVLAAAGGAALAVLVAGGAPAARSAPAGSTALAPAPVWAGTWQTNKGPLVLAVSGARATGTYGYADASNDPLAHVTGTVGGASFSGGWQFDSAEKAPLDKGTFVLAWSWVNGQATFTGKYTFTGNGTVVDWQGACVAGACFADRTRPLVKAMPAEGARGTAVVLRYVVADERLYASETVTVLRGSSVVWRKAVPLHGAADEGAVSAVAWTAPAKAAGSWHFTVTARDKAGNSATASAAIRLR